MNEGIVYIAVDPLPYVISIVDRLEVAETFIRLQSGPLMITSKSNSKITTSGDPGTHAWNVAVCGVVETQLESASEGGESTILPLPSIVKNDTS